MATSISTSLPDLVFSSHLKDLSFSSDLDKFIVELKYDNSIFFSTTLYTYNRATSLYDIRMLIEDYMLTFALAFASITIIAKSDAEAVLCSKSIDVLYCSRLMYTDATAFVKANFLTLLPSKRTYPHSTEHLSALLTGIGPHPISINCHFLGNDYSQNSATLDFEPITTDCPRLYNMTFIYDDIVNRLVSIGYTVKDIISYSVSIDARRFTFYIHRPIPDCCFTFRNCFNVDEVASFMAVTTKKTTTESSLAVSSATYSQYDRITETSYEVQSAPLLHHEAEWIDQLFASPFIRLGSAYDDTFLPPVIITESSCEISDTNSSLNHVKFSWQYQDLRACHYNFLNLDDRIHSPEFSPQFN